MTAETVALRDICKELKLDPREARLKLRATGKRAKGRWEWPKAQVAEIKKVLTADAPAKKATGKGKAKKPAKTADAAKS